MTGVDVEQVELDDIIALRREVLRRGTPSTSPAYEEDSDPTVRHLAVRDNGEVVACSTWIVRRFPHSPHEHAMQLKGMAVREHLQGTGVGREVLRAGIALARDSRCTIVWARARDSAVGFYERNGFTVVGEGFVDDTTGLPHHMVELRLGTETND